MSRCVPYCLALSISALLAPALMAETTRGGGPGASPRVIFTSVGSPRVVLIPEIAVMPPMEAGEGGADNSTYQEPAPLTLPPPIAEAPAPSMAASRKPAVETTSAGFGGQPVSQLFGSSMRFSMKPMLEVQATFDDNIFISHDHKEADLYHTLRAGAALGFGDYREALNNLGRFQEQYDGLATPDKADHNYVYAIYTPGATIFASHADQDTFDQDAALGAVWRFGNLASSLRASYQRYSEAFVNTGTRERVSFLQTNLGNVYEFSDKTSLEANFFQRTLLFDNAARIDSTEFSNQDFFNYQMMPKTAVAVGTRVGYLDVSRGPAQTFEQAIVRVMYDSQHKVQGSIFGGVEFRQVDGGEDSTNPVFGFNVDYVPRESTHLSIYGSRQVTNSADLADENIISTSVALRAAQEIGKTELVLRAGYENLDYDTVNSGLSEKREDDIYTLSLEWSFHVSKWTQLTIGYAYWRADSTRTDFSFDDNRASVRVDVLF